MYSFRMSFWVVPPRLGPSGPARLRRQEVHPPDDVRRAVDRHARGDVRSSGIPRRSRSMSGERGDVHPALPDLAERLRVVGVDPVERRVVERDRQPGLPVLQEVAEAGVGVLRGPEPGEHPHRPEPPAGTSSDGSPACTGNWPGLASALIVPAARGVQAVDRDPAEGFETDSAARARGQGRGARPRLPSASEPPRQGPRADREGARCRGAAADVGSPTSSERTCPR